LTFPIQNRKKMVYLLNNNINGEKPVRVALTIIFGVGRKSCSEICDSLGISPNIRINHLSTSQLDLLSTTIEENYSIGLDLASVIKQDRERYKTLSSYRGIRHVAGLPCRGQRTHTNGKTARVMNRGEGLKKGMKKKKKGSP
jgi:small subunit ribosomal protein S13